MNLKIQALCDVAPSGLLCATVSEKYAVCIVTIAQASRLELPRNLNRHRYAKVISMFELNLEIHWL